MKMKSKQKKKFIMTKESKINILLKKFFFYYIVHLSNLFCGFLHFLSFRTLNEIQSLLVMIWFLCAWKIFYWFFKYNLYDYSE